VLVIAVVFLVAGFAKLGFITQFLSKPVMDGFVLGIAVIFDSSNQEELDYTSTLGVSGLVKELTASGIDVYFVGVRAPVLAEDRTGLLAPIAEGHLFPTMEAAVRHVEAAL
jgi:MFS superfamily sulfate permease-like transporter